MTLRRLQKWHGAGNDFLVDVMEPAETWWDPSRARAACDRRLGVGADGVAVATLGEGVSMVLWNADGTVAEMSGNGVRCVAAAVRRSTGGTWDEIDVATDAGERRVHLSMDGPDGYGGVSMGTVTLADPPAGALGLALVGNPHVVVDDDPGWSDAQREELARQFGDEVGATNVEFVTVLDKGHVSMTVIERGVGWTLACGTGSCAVAAVLRDDGRVGDDVVVDNPGGALRVTLEGGGATLYGPVHFVADVDWNAP
ncbi:MAG TPA: diaminopimelate epimerase [Acidimicrobiales bacterium]|nr:diaminopimelate epimerase [Acidimicrobiales bacterium]